MTAIGCSKPELKPRRRYLGLQVLRFVAALMVVVTHSGFYVSERLIVGYHFWHEGTAGVDIFFVLSGFVMIYSSTKLFGDPTGWMIFAERRIVRIVPIYWVATLAKVTFLLSAGSMVLHAKLSVFGTIASLLFLPARNATGEIGPLLGVGWTLNFEMFFYVLFALALFLRVNVYKFVGIILIPLAAGAFIRHSDWPAISFYLNTSVLEFFYGMLIARWCLGGRHLPANAALLGLLVGFVAIIAPWGPMRWGHDILHGLGAALIIWAAASLEDHLPRIPQLLLYLGDATYAIYLFHPLIAPGVPAIFARLHWTVAWACVSCTVVVALFAGAALHEIAEEPITRFFKERVRVNGQTIIHVLSTTDRT